MPNYSSRDMAIHATADIEKALKTPKPGSSFQVGEYQLKKIRELAKMLDAETKIPNRDALPTPPAPLMNKISKLTSVEDHTTPPPQVDPDEEYKDKDQKISIPIQTTPPSAVTREKYTKKLK